MFNPRPYDFEYHQVFKGYDPLEDLTVPPLPEGFTESRFKVITLPHAIFAVSDTLTNTIREVTSCPRDAAEIASRLELELDYAGGRRWPMPERD